MKTTTPMWPVVAALAVLGGAGPLGAQFHTELEPATVQAYERYLSRAESQMGERWRGGRPFLWLEEDSRRRERVARGEVVVDRGQCGVKPAAPDGMIHHWIAAAKIPGARSVDVAALLEDFPRHRAAFRDVTDSRLLGRQGEEIRGYQRITRKKILTVVLETDLQARVYRPSPEKGYSVSRTVRVQEVDNPGQSSEKLFPPGQGHGFLWSVYANWRFQDTADGVLVECESVSLSRDVPFLLARIIRPLVEEVPREALEAMLEDTRKALRR